MLMPAQSEAREVEMCPRDRLSSRSMIDPAVPGPDVDLVHQLRQGDRKSTRLNSSHSQISYAVFCLKKKEVLPFLVRLPLSLRSLQTHHVTRCGRRRPLASPLRLRRPRRRPPVVALAASAPLPCLIL